MSREHKFVRMNNYSKKREKTDKRPNEVSEQFLNVY